MISVADAMTFPAPAGSMGPKLRACADFVGDGGSYAAIGRLEDGVAVLEGSAGTRVTP